MTELLEKHVAAHSESTVREGSLRFAHCSTLTPYIE
jgi:hypothetical protein